MARTEWEVTMANAYGGEEGKGLSAGTDKLRKLMRMQQYFRRK